MAAGEKAEVGRQPSSLGMQMKPKMVTPMQIMETKFMKLGRRQSTMRMKAPTTPTRQEADPHGEIDVIYENEEAETVDNAEEIEAENTQEILTATSKADGQPEGGSGLL